MRVGKRRGMREGREGDGKGKRVKKGEIMAENRESREGGKRQSVDRDERKDREKTE